MLLSFGKSSLTLFGHFIVPDHISIQVLIFYLKRLHGDTLLLAFCLESSQKLSSLDQFTSQMLFVASELIIDTCKHIEF